MRQIETWQMRSIYGIGKTLGISTGGRDDNLHQLVEATTGKDSISSLTYEEAQSVIADLRARSAGAEKTAATERRKLSGGMTTGQTKKVWGLMYDLQAHDKVRSEASLGDRLCGIIKRELGVDATAKDPMRWLTYKQGTRLIEAIKGYVTTAERGDNRDADGVAEACAHGGSAGR